ncbi:hypothetical protein GGR56DRAFT_629852 [Xylariaceae sp. FL0804]|nr:hypothetical protein GGR56DRAFT_629852 [Xylariaceae sp. FL0804]
MAIRSIEDLSAKTAADICEVVREQLKNRALRTLKESQRPSWSASQDDSDMACFVRLQYDALLRHTWPALLERLRVDAPAALEGLFDELGREPVADRDRESAVRPPTTSPLTPPSAARATYITDQHFREPAASELRAAVANMEPAGLDDDDDASLDDNSSVRSFTLPAFPQVAAQAVRSPAPSAIEVGSPDLGNPVVARTPPDSGRKRPASQQDVVSPKPTKKPKTSYNTEIKPWREALQSGRECKESECVFKYKDQPGYYVLRCDEGNCARMLGRRDVYFSRHPFQNGLAMRHFGGKNHNIEDEDTVFREFARRVKRAKQEHNIHGPNNPRSLNHGITTPAEAADPPPPDSPSLSRDTGKQHERRVDPGYRFVKVKPSSSAARGARPRPAALQPRDRTAHAGPSSPSSSSSSSSSFPELLSHERRSRRRETVGDTAYDGRQFSTADGIGISTGRPQNKRGLARPSYQEKPPTLEEFQEM